MGFVERSLPQILTYWAPGAPDGLGGIAFSAPTFRDGLWADTAELFRDAQGREVTSSATACLGDDVALGGYLALGEYGDTNPTTVTGAREIRGFKKVTDLRGEEAFRKAWL